MRLLLLCCFLLACGATPQAKPGETTVLSLQEINCQTCGSGAATRLRAEPGVYEVTFDAKAAELSLRYDAAKTSPEALASFVKTELGFAVEVGAGKGRYEAKAKWPPELDMKHLPTGVLIDPSEHLVPGKITVIDYWAEWCGPCVEVDRFLVSLARKTPKLAVRKVDLVDWSSPIAKSGEVTELPYVVVYAPDGRRLGAARGLELEHIAALVARAQEKQ